MTFIDLPSLACGRYEGDETPHSLVVPTVRRETPNRWEVRTMRGIGVKSYDDFGE